MHSISWLRIPDDLSRSRPWPCGWGVRDQLMRPRAGILVDSYLGVAEGDGMGTVLRTKQAAYCTVAYLKQKGIHCAGQGDSSS